MKSSLFFILATLSLLLLLVTCMLWMRSYRLFEYVEMGNGRNSEFIVGQLRGRVYLHWESNAYNPDQPVYYYSHPTGGVEIGFIYAPPKRLLYGFGWFDAQTPGTARLRIGVFPHWFAALLLAVVPVTAQLRRRKLILAAGCCARCGYDLRATPSRCPECGAASNKVRT